MTKSQAFIERNRPPRVQIEYEVHVGNAEKLVQLPFVMGVLADLSGQRDDATAQPNEYQFLGIDSENFDQRMKAIDPHLRLSVPNALEGDGKLVVDLKFQSMDDFLPGSIARQNAALKKLLDARNDLANLLTLMDGRAEAEKLIARVLQDNDVLNALKAAGKASDTED